MRLVPKQQKLMYKNSEPPTKAMADPSATNTCSTKAKGHTCWYDWGRDWAIKTQTPGSRNITSQNSSALRDDSNIYRLGGGSTWTTHDLTYHADYEQMYGEDQEEDRDEEQDEAENMGNPEQEQYGQSKPKSKGKGKASTMGKGKAKAKGTNSRVASKSKALAEP
jgi:hypothetical protein